MTRLFLLLLLFLSACLPRPQAVPSPAARHPTLPIATAATLTIMVTPPPDQTPMLASPLTPTPGLILRGHIRLAAGPELANVTICRNYASYPGEIVATTDTAGYFQSAFAFIPGDEMVGVWAEMAGYSFDPPYYRWRHYYGYEDSTLDFVASPTSATPVPPDACSQGN